MKYVIGLLLLAASGCNPAESTQEKEISTEEISLITESETCYLYTNGDEHQDSTFVSLQLKGDSVLGYMHWQPWEKDGAYGTISAVKTGNKIFGVYDYMIEGSEQSQEVLFKIIDGKLYQGEGELTEIPGESVMLVYKDTSTLEFTTTFRVIACEKFEKY